MHSITESIIISSLNWLVIVPLSSTNYAHVLCNPSHKDRHWPNASAAPTDAIHRKQSLKRLPWRSSEEPETLAHVFQESSFWGGFLVALVPARSCSFTRECHIGKEPVVSWWIQLSSLILYSRGVQAQLWLGLSWADFTQVSICSIIFFWRGCLCHSWHLWNFDSTLLYRNISYFIHFTVIIILSNIKLSGQE